MASSRHSGRTKNLGTRILNYKYEAERANLSWWRLLNSKPCPQWSTSSSKTPPLKSPQTASPISDKYSNIRSCGGHFHPNHYENVKIKPIILYDGWICTNKIIIRLRKSLRSKECKESESPVTPTGCLIPKWRTEAGDSWQFQSASTSRSRRPTKYREYLHTLWISTCTYFRNVQWMSWLWMMSSWGTGNLRVCKDTLSSLHVNLELLIKPTEEIEKSTHTLIACFSSYRDRGWGRHHVQL